MDTTASTHDTAPAAPSQRLRRAPAAGGAPARAPRHYPVQVRASFRRLARPSALERSAAPASLS